MYVAQPIAWTDRGVVVLDQRRLPAEEVSYTYTDYREVAKAIREMVIRGAPAIGVAAGATAQPGSRPHFRPIKPQTRRRAGSGTSPGARRWAIARRKQEALR